MAVLICGVEKRSPASRAGMTEGETLLTINGNGIADVLDYRFYQQNEVLELEFCDNSGNIKTATVKKQEFDELGLNFNTYLMDKQRSCKSECLAPPKRCFFVNSYFDRCSRRYVYGR